MESESLRIKLINIASLMCEEDSSQEALEELVQLIEELEGAA